MIKVLALHPKCVGLLYVIKSAFVIKQNLLLKKIALFKFLFQQI